MAGDGSPFVSSTRGDMTREEERERPTVLCVNSVEVGWLLKSLIEVSLVVQLDIARPRHVSAQGRISSQTTYAEHSSYSTFVMKRSLSQHCEESPVS